MPPKNYPELNNTETESFQQNFEHIQKEVKELSDADQNNDAIEGIDGILTEEFSNYLKQNPGQTSELYCDISKHIENSTDPNLKILQEFLKPIFDSYIGNLIINGDSWEGIMNSLRDKEKTKSYMEDFKKDIIEKLLPANIFRFNEKEGTDEESLNIARTGFNKEFLTITKKVVKENVPFSTAIKVIPLKRPITMNDIKIGEEELHKKAPDNNYRIDLSGEILPDLDWSSSREVFGYLSYDDKTFSQTSNNHFPEGYNPEQVFRNGKNPGLGVREVHEMGYTGEGVHIAICDWKLKDHDGINVDSYFEGENVKNIDESMHSAAVTSIATGEATGIAPKANLHFFAKWRNENEPNGGNDLIDAFKQILQYNQTCLENNNIKDQIRVVSISGPIFGGEYAKNLVNELENSGVLVISGDNFSHDFGYLGKKDPMGNPDTFDNYKYCFGNSNALFVNSGDRTVADSRDKSAYRYDSDASASWAIPVVASYYTLACQADPSMTPEKFKNLARATAHKMDSGIEGVGTIEVINIKNLIDTIIKGENK